MFSCFELRARLSAVIHRTTIANKNSCFTLQHCFPDSQVFFLVVVLFLVVSEGRWISFKSTLTLDVARSLMLDASSLNFDMPRCEKSDTVTDENMETMAGWMFFPQPSEADLKVGIPGNLRACRDSFGWLFFQFRILGGDRRPRWVQWQKLRFWRWTSLAFFGILGLLSIKIPPTSPAKKTTLGNNPFFLMDFYREDVPKSEIWQVFPNRSLLWRGFIYPQFRSSLPIEHLVYHLGGPKMDHESKESNAKDYHSGYSSGFDLRSLWGIRRILVLL